MLLQYFDLWIQAQTTGSHPLNHQHGGAGAVDMISKPAALEVERLKRRRHHPKYPTLSKTGKAGVPT